MTNKSIPSYQFAPEDASGIAREWSGIASALPRKLFTLLFCLLFVGVGNVWGTSATWSLVTSEPADWSGEYLIVYNAGCFDGSLTSGFDQSSTVSVSISSNSITLDDKYSVTVSKVSSKYYIQTASGYYIGRSANSNGFDASTTRTDDYAITFASWSSTNKTIKITGKGGRCLGSNSSNSYKWRFFANSNAYVNVKLFKKDAGCDGTPLDAPTVTATPSSNSIALSWPNDANATSYTVTCKNTSSGVAAGSVGSVTGTTTKTCTISSLTNGTEYTWSVTAIGNGTTKCNSDPTSANAIPGTYYTVTFMNNGETYATKSIRSGTNLILPDNPSTCDVSKEFVGWSTTNIGSTPTNTKPTMKSTFSTISSATTLYAVFAQKTANSYKLGDANDLIEGQKVLIVNQNASQAMSNTNNSGKLTATDVTISSSTISSPAASLIWTVELDGATKYKFKNTYYVYAYSTSAVYCDDDDRKYPDSWTLTYASSTGKYYMHSDRSTSSYRLQDYSSNFKLYTSNTTEVFKQSFFIPAYTKYVTQCCTPLGSINGSVSWTNGTSATLTWDKLSNVDGTTPYSVTCKVTGGSSAGSVGDIDLTGDDATCTVTSLTAGTGYTFTINAFGDATHCDKSQEIVATAPKITVTDAPVALSGSDYAEGSGPGSVKSFYITGVGLEAGNLTITAPTNFQVSTDGGTNWGTSGGSQTLAVDGTLSSTEIKVRLVTDLSEGTYGGATTYVTISGGGAAAVNSSVSITGTVSSACSVPTIGNPSLTSITGTTITVSCPTISGGTNCDVDEYGFIWKAGSAPTMDSYDGKKKTGENNQSTAYNDGLSIDVANNTGTTYYIKAYAHNSAGNNVSGTALQVTPQKVTFNSNGGSDVATAYVNNGGTVSQPSNPTKTHYTFGGWYTDNGTWKSAVSFSSTITEDKTYYAKWNPVSYTITTSGLTNVAPTSDFPTSFTYTGSTTTDLNRTLAVDVDNFFLPDALTVTMGGSTLTAGTDYTYSNSTGAFTFAVAITGNIVISGSAVAKLKSIAITTTPTKTVYFAGEAFSNTGAVVTATMGDETTKAVSGSAVWTPSGALTAEASKTMTATYTERGISKTATTTVDVYSVTVNKVNEDGDAISADGVTATWTVGTKALAAGIGSTNYVFKEWAFVGSNNGLSISSTTSANTTITGTPTGNVTIKAVFYKPVAVTWTVNGESYTTGGPDVSVKRGTQWKNVKLPTAPADNTFASSSCDVDKFMGWTNMGEHWVGVTHDDAPTVCLTSFSGVTTEITAPIEFKAVFAKEEAGDDATITLNYTAIGSGYASTNIDIDGVTFARTNWGGMNTSTNYYVQGKNSTSMYNTTAIPGAIKSVEIDQYGGSGNFYVGTSSNPSTNETTISDGTTNFSTSNNYQYIKFYSTSTVQITSAVITYVPVEYSDYITLCSSTNITISDPSITGEGEITFDQESPVPTCLAGQTITATVTPASGYECTALSFTGGSVSVSPTIADVLPLTEETEFELSFAKDANGTLATSATFSPKAVTDWTWTYGGEAIPNPVNLYVGEKARFDVTYEPSDVIAEKKTYTRTKVDTYMNWYGGGIQPTYFQCQGKASTGESTTTVTVTHADGPTQDIYIKVKPLPTVTFVDNVHNLTDFTNWGTDGVVASTESSGVITHTKVTPSHDNIDEPGTGNTCEKQHLHLVGWIRSDYDKVADYMDGTSSDKPTESEILGAGTDGKGLEYFFAPNASINIETYNGLTFYAVWALVE